MHPRVVTTPFFTVHTFGLLLAAAYIAAYWWLTREGRRTGLDVDALALFGFWAIIGAVIGARVLMILRTLPEYTAAPAELFSPLSSKRSEPRSTSANAGAAFESRLKPRCLVYQSTDA